MNKTLKQLQDKAYKTGFNIYSFEGKLKKAGHTLPDEVWVKVLQQYLIDKPKVKKVWPWFARVLEHEIGILNARAEEAKTAKFKSEPVKIGNIMKLLGREKE